MSEGDTTERVREREVFLGALECGSSEARRAFLDRACGTDARLRSVVEDLLQAHDDGDFMRTSASGGLRAETAGAGQGLAGMEGPGDRIGPYRLERVVGEGGCGTVYLAQQEEPVRRRVALKILRAGMDTRSVIARFETERQALAWMDHPCIARVLDAGASSGGRPYFVMEYIEGVRITEHCERSGLGLEERLRLFLGVCQAVQHAHQKGVIHRDLKPSNVLVGMADGDAVPKVIDFGIAKALDPGRPGETQATSMLAMLGTPAFMSPEQAESGGGDVDTRADVYGLGALLYDMLTGSPPLDPARLARLGFEGLRKVLREEVPVPPSRCRGARKAWRSDLDWVVMKCLEKDRSRRYATVNDLSQDVQRYLKGEPVTARAPRVGYLMRRFIARHRAAVVAVSLVIVSVVGGLGVSIWQVLEQRRLAHLAESARREQERLRGVAEATAETARRREYIADINFAASAIRDRDLGRARKLLDSHVPRGGEVDYRGWEWWYLRRSFQSEAWYTLGRCPGGVVALEPSADGRSVAVGGLEGGVGWWDLSEKREMEHWSTGEEPAVLAVSPKGSGVAFWVRDAGGHRVRVWDATEQEFVFEPTVAGKVLVLAFDREGVNLMAILSTGEWVRWSLPGRVESGRGTLPFVADGVGLAATPDLSAVGMVTADGVARVVDAATGRERWNRRVTREESVRVVFSGDGVILATWSRMVGAVRLFEAENGNPLGMAPMLGTRPNRVRFSPDGNRLAAAGADPKVSISDLSIQPALEAMRRRSVFMSGLEPARRGAARREGMAADPRAALSGRPQLAFRGHEREVLALAWLPDHRTLLSADRDGEILAWDTQNVGVDPVASRYVPDGAKGWGFGDDGGESLLTVDAQGQVRRWRWADDPVGELLFEVGPVDGTTRISEDGRYLAVGGMAGRAAVWNVSGKKRECSLEIGSESVEPMAFARREGRLVVRDHEGRLREWDFLEHREVQVWSGMGKSGSGVVGISADGKWCVAVGQDGEAMIYDVEAGTGKSLELGVRGVRRVVLDPTGARWVVVTGSGDGSVWDRRTGTRVARLEGFQSGMRTVAFSPDGRRLAAAGDTMENVRIYETEDFREVLAVDGGIHASDSVGFSPDGRGLVAGSTSGKLIFWRTQEGGGKPIRPTPE